MTPFRATKTTGLATEFLKPGGKLPPSLRHLGSLPEFSTSLSVQAYLDTWTSDNTWEFPGFSFSPQDALVITALKQEGCKFSPDVSQQKLEILDIVIKLFQSMLSSKDTYDRYKKGSFYRCIAPDINLNGLHRWTCAVAYILARRNFLKTEAPPVKSTITNLVDQWIDHVDGAGTKIIAGPATRENMRPQKSLPTKTTSRKAAIETAKAIIPQHAQHASSSLVGAPKTASNVSLPAPSKRKGTEIDRDNVKRRHISAGTVDHEVQTAHKELSADIKSFKQDCNARSHMLDSHYRKLKLRSQNHQQRLDGFEKASKATFAEIQNTIRRLSGSIAEQSRAQADAQAQFQTSIDQLHIQLCETGHAVHDFTETMEFIVQEQVELAFQGMAQDQNHKLAKLSERIDQSALSFERILESNHTYQEQRSEILRKDLANQASTMEKQDSTIDQHSASIAQQDATIQQQGTDIGHLLEIVEAQSADKQAQDSKIAALEDILSTQASILLQQNEEINQLRASLAGQAATISQQGSDIAELKENVSLLVTLQGKGSQ